MNESAETGADDAHFLSAKNSADQLIESAETTALDILDKAENQAAAIIADAEQRARKIEEDAIDKAKDIYDKQREEAQEDGYAQGFDAGQSEAQVLIDEAIMIKEEWTIKKNQFINRVEREIIKLVMSTVENIINRELRDETYVLDLIKKGIDQLTYTSSLVVRLSEYDYDFAAANRSKILAMVEGIDNVEVKKDFSLEHGDCVIDTDTGSLDVGIHSQIDQVKQIFEALLAGE